MLKRTICNLINNPIDATAGTGKIWVKSFLEDNLLNISIQDDGAGFHGDVEDMFEQGFTNKKNGYGLGLSGEKKFVVSIGGMITINKLEKETLVIVSRLIIT